MSKVNLLKPNKENINLFLGLGVLFFSLGIFDFYLNSLVWSFLNKYHRNVYKSYSLRI